MTMRRSGTEYNNRSTCKSHGILLEFHQEQHLHSPRGFGEKKQVFGSQHNASWDLDSMLPKQQRAAPRCPELSSRSPNIFLKNDQELNGLLNMLHTDQFSGKIDPKHHAHYINIGQESTSESMLKAADKQAQRYRSDGHLLQMRAS